MKVEDKNGNIIEYKGVYVVDCFGWFVDCYAFRKKDYPTKEIAIQKFKEITNNADIYGEIKESYVRFLWWTYTSGYEYREQDIMCGYRTVKDKGRGAVDCWVISQDLHWEKMFEDDKEDEDGTK